MFVVNGFSYPVCDAIYIGKIEISLYEKTVEHAWTDNNSALCKHLDDCTGVQNLFDIASLHSSRFIGSAPIQNSDKVDLRTTLIDLLQNNTEITDRHKSWNILFLQEAL